MARLFLLFPLLGWLVLVVGDFMLIDGWLGDGELKADLESHC